ncbi:hypothetical protein ACFY4K_09820 [Streptomyces leeuwenhoekii]|uniref:hypothetical protein n=1 Tax=Streptomyces leeuwenhoekii TaxID=1437453 RepID=UPI0036B158C5
MLEQQSATAPASAGGGSGEVSDSLGVRNAQQDDEARSFVAQVLGAAVPESSEPGRGLKWGLTRLGMVLVGALVLIVLTAAIERWYTNRNAEDDATVQDVADDKVDAKKDPFVAKVSTWMDDSYAHEAWVLPRRLTPSEKQQLMRDLDGLGENHKAATQAIWNVVKGVGARRILGAASIYNLQLTSERKNSVVVTRLTAETTRCWKPEGVIWMSAGTGGVEGWEDISFELKGAEVPAMKNTGDVNNPAIEEFEDVISLGGQESPGFIKIAPYIFQRSCEFKVNLYYNVNGGKTQKKTISEDGNGEKLVFHAPPYSEGVETWTLVGDRFDVQ